MFPLRTILHFQRSALAVAFTALAGACAGGSPSDEPTPDLSKKAKVVTFDVSGMTCSGCTTLVRDAIAELEGIEKQDIVVDADAHTATVGLDEGDPTVEQIVAHFADIDQYKLKPRV